MNGQEASMSRTEIFRDSLRYGFRALKNNPWLFVKASLVGLLVIFPLVVLGYIALMFVGYIIMHAESRYMSLLGLGICALVAAFLWYGFNAGFLRFGLQLHDEGRTTIKRLFSGFGYAWRCIVATLVIGFLSILPALVVLGVSIAMIDRTIIQRILGAYGVSAGHAVSEMSKIPGASDTHIMLFLVCMAIAVLMGIFIHLRYSFSLLAIVDKYARTLEALKRSWVITKGLDMILVLVLYLCTFGPLHIIGHFLTPVATPDKSIVYHAFSLIFGVLSIMVFIIVSMARVRLYRLLLAKHHV